MDPDKLQALSLAQEQVFYLEDFPNNPQKPYDKHAKFAERLCQRGKEKAEARGAPASYPHTRVSSINPPT